MTYFHSQIHYLHFNTISNKARSFLIFQLFELMEPANQIHLWKTNLKSTAEGLRSETWKQFTGIYYANQKLQFNLCRKLDLEETFWTLWLVFKQSKLRVVETTKLEVYILKINLEKSYWLKLYIFRWNGWQNVSSEYVI